MLLLNGERAGYRAYEQAARDVWPGVRVETVPGAGGFPHQEQGPAVAERLAACLTSLDVGTDAGTDAGTDDTGELLRH